MVEEKEQIQVEVKKQPSCQVEIIAKADENLIKKAENNAIKTVSKKVSLPGFRKGKAPKELILKNHRSEVEKEKRQELANLAFAQVQKKTALFPISSASINFDLKKITEKEADLVFKYEVEPDVPSIDPKNLKIKEIPKRTVSEEELEEAIRQTRFYFANFKEVDRPIKEGDYVIVDLDSLDTEKPTRVFSDTRFEVKKKAIADWMIDLLLGAKKGQAIEGLSYPDPDLKEAEKEKFESKKVKITVKKIEEATLPEIDDNLAQKMGSENVTKMKEKIKEILQQNLDEDHGKKQSESLSEHLFIEYPFELPLSLVTSELAHRKSQLFSNQKFKASYDRMKSEEKAKIETDLKRHAEKAIALFYLSRKIVHDNKLEISKEEIEQLLTQEAKGQKITEQMYALAMSRLILSKAENFLLKHRQR